MPYGKQRKYRRYRRRPYRKSQPWYAKKYSAMDAGRYALRQVWRLKGLVNSEMYKFDTQLTGTVPDTGGINAVTNIAQGDTGITRTGNSIYVRSVNWKGQVFRSTSGNVAQTMRLMVVMDSQQVGDTTPAISDILSSVTTYSHLNVSTVGRFKILATKIIVLSSTGDLVKNFEINLPMRHHVRYNGTGASDVQKGGLYCVTISDQASANYPSIQSECRVSYHDN